MNYPKPPLRRRQFNWFYIILSLQLAGALLMMCVVGWVVIHRQTVPPTVKTYITPTPRNMPATIRPTIAPQAAIQTVAHCTESHGTVLDKTFYSASAQDTVPYRVYLPPCYNQTNRRYPYVILLHGAGSDQTEWTDTLGVNQVLDRGIAAGKLPPMILIMPYGGALEYYNEFTPPQSFESFILTDLLPEIENNYCTWNAQAGRDIAGISRGGFWAFEIGFRHPDLFGSLAGHSPYFDPTNAPADYNPINLEQTVAFSVNTTPRLWLDVAADDSQTRQYLDGFAQILTDRHIDPGYVVYPTGEHDAAYWQSHLEEYLTFYGRTWPIDPVNLSMCR
jgi:enterochelin esterase-like enzyme